LEKQIAEFGLKKSAKKGTAAEILSSPQIQWTCREIYNGPALLAISLREKH
jgi:hypothetical protein